MRVLMQAFLLSLVVVASCQSTTAEQTTLAETTVSTVTTVTTVTTVAETTVPTVPVTTVPTVPVTTVPTVPVTTVPTVPVTTVPTVPVTTVPTVPVTTTVPATSAARTVPVTVPVTTAPITAPVTTARAQTTVPSAPTTTTVPPLTRPAGVATTGENAARTTRFAKGENALIVVALVRVQSTGNVTVVSEIASSKFLVEVDKLAQLTLPGSWVSFGSVAGVQVVVSVLWNKTSATSFTITSSQPVPFVLQGLSVAFFEAWIGVNAGSPEVLSWQSQCNGASLFGLPSDQCASSQCVVSFCGQPVSRCNASSSNSTTSPCDVRMYLGWMGPDANNQICTSASLLPANFNLFSSGSLIAVISGQFSDFVYGVLNSASGARVSLVILMFVCLLFAQ